MSKLQVQTQVLKAVQLSKTLGNGKNAQRVLQDISFCLNEGEVSAVAGPSGCGKTTLLYLLGLLDNATEGEIWIGSALTQLLSEAQKNELRNTHIGFIFQFHFLLKEFTALENVFIPTYKKNSVSKKQIQNYANYLLNAVGLYEKKNRLPSELSGGEQQRVAIARALINRPRIILADEPTGNLDAKNSMEIFNLLYTLTKEQNQGLLLVTHNPVLAARCDHIWEMRDGRMG